MERNNTSPQKITFIAIALAELELFHARHLAWNLPSQDSFDSHSDIGLDIGTIGRRIKILIDSAGFKVNNSIAPTPFENWEKALIQNTKKKGPSYETIYRSILNYIKKNGYATYDFQAAIEACLQLELRSNLKTCSPLCTKNIVKSLLDFDEKPDRVFNNPTQTRRGNLDKKYDKRWKMVHAGFKLRRIKKIENKEGLLHKLHHTAFRESIATEVAALNIFEYDCMPWQFYIDMARQCEDEVRHSLIMRDRLIELGGKLGQYPISFLGNFYHMFWEMTLSERLVAMNLDTEGSGQAYLGNVSERLNKIGDKKSSSLFKFLQFDEKRHARFGGKWLKYLYPDIKERKDAIETCRAFTVINLASGAVPLVGGRIEDIIKKWLNFRSIVNTEPMTKKHENEISLLSARNIQKVLV